MGKSAAESRGNTRKTGRLHILMADDDTHEHLLMSMAAEEASKPITLDFVPDGGQLLTELYVPATLDGLPNAIILDLKMPGLDGARTLLELRQHPMFWQIPAVVFSNSTRPKDRQIAYDRGAVLYETKPRSFGETRAFLERVIDIAKPSSEYVGEAGPSTRVALGSHATPSDLLQRRRFWRGSWGN